MVVMEVLWVGMVVLVVVEVQPMTKVLVVADIPVVQAIKRMVMAVAGALITMVQTKAIPQVFNREWVKLL
jgi:hypothetical protein